jgi:hypothetical protein
MNHYTVMVGGKSKNRHYISSWKINKCNYTTTFLGSRWVTIFRQNSTAKTQKFRIDLHNRQK